MPSETPPPKIPSPSASVSVLEQQQRPKTPSSVPLVSSTPSSSSQLSHLNPNCQQGQQTGTTTATQQEQQSFSSLPTTSQNHSEPQQFCLKWNSYQSNLTSEFDQLLQNESFVDVTLACDGHSIKAHKMVLSACSPYFQALFFDNPCQHPIIIMKEVKWPELKAVVEYMYKGEINVSQDQIAPLLRVAQMLKIRGLADVNGDQDVNTSASSGASGSANGGSQSGSGAGGGKTDSINVKKPRLARDFDVHERSSNNGAGGASSSSSGGQSSRDGGENLTTTARSGRKRRWLTGENQTGAGSPVDTSTPDNLEPPSPIPIQNHPSSSITHPPTSTPTPSMPFPVPPHLDTMGLSSLALNNPDDMEIKPGIAEMIREEERAKLLENSHAWLGASTSSIADSYQYQLQSMWQKCWNTNQNIIHHLRFRERGPLKSWRPETMAEAIFSVLKEGLSLSQAARKYDIPYPTFVLYANRVHNMLGPSIDGGTDLRPKGRGRPQRILLGIWPDDHIRGVIKTVVFRDAKELKDESIPMGYGRHSPIFPFQEGALNYSGSPCTNGLGPQAPPVTGPESMSPDAAAAAAVAAVAHGIRQQIQMAAAAQHHPDAANLVAAGGFNLPAHLNIHPNNGGSASSIPMPKLGSPATPGQLSSGNGSGAIPMPRHGSPALAGGAGHGLAALTGLHGLPGLPSVSVSTTRETVTSSGPASSGTGSQGHMSSPLGGGGLNITRLASPGSAHDLRMASPDDNSLNSSLEMALEPAVNLAVGVSGMSYKSRGYTSPRQDNLFQEDISDIVGAPRSCPSRLSGGFKESGGVIKLEPVAECRSE
ncbi:protein bric-a-brac 1-like isoform X1 [Phlebotomus papatasi]|uniref:protein bric-a-brac 1-like isoform X1 n=1 Tax=Phlebotomus papatasi TaxID=29031 RepID=UPI0024846C37|nr:protein bric-a-brac 1-like isoform X1 [Phlebotomus papatasi]